MSDAVQIESKEIETLRNNLNSVIGQAVDPPPPSLRNILRAADAVQLLADH
jgi:hypothetical protein